MLWLRFQAASWVRIALPAVAVAALAAAGSFVLAGASVLPVAGVLLIAAGGAAVGALIGVLLGERNESFAILEPLGSRRSRAAALPAVRRGPVPADPAIRHAACELARLQLSFRRATQRRQIIVMVLFAVFFGLLALDSHGWISGAVKLGVAAVYAVLAVRYSGDVRRLQDRIPLLAESA